MCESLGELLNPFKSPKVNLFPFLLSNVQFDFLVEFGPSKPKKNVPKLVEMATLGREAAFFGFRRGRTLTWLRRLDR